jgi:hypothetical protein
VESGKVTKKLSVTVSSSIDCGISKSRDRLTKKNRKPAPDLKVESKVFREREANVLQLRQKNFLTVCATFLCHDILIRVYVFLGSRQRKLLLIAPNEREISKSVFIHIFALLLTRSVNNFSVANKIKLAKKKSINRKVEQRETQLNDLEIQTFN